MSRPLASRPFMRRPLSISVRLALLFATVAVLVFAAVGFFLNGALTQRMQSHDDQYLVAKAGLVRHILEQTPSLAALRADPNAVLNAVYGDDGFLLRLRATDGSVLLQNAAPSRPFPEASGVPVGQPVASVDVLDWQPAVGQGRVVSAMALIGGFGGMPVQVTVARALEGGSLLVKNYAKDLVVAVCIGAVLVAG
ncbi:MAG TPA: two-component sensor histidine kinase, partial [Janthinobacterium sp.]|nr:two-component sensor histidine kinase [Janthinobacterium sp.]